MDKNDDALQRDIDLNALNDLLPGGLPPGFVTNKGKELDRYWRGPTKKLRNRAKVLKRRKMQKLSRRHNRGGVNGQKNHKGKHQRNTV